MNSRKLNLVLLAAVAATLVAACGGGSDGRRTPPPSSPPAKQAPQILGLQDQTLPQDTTVGPLQFQVADADSGAGSVTLTATSSDASVIPAGGIVLGGSGANRTLQITPAAETFGTTMLTIRAVDPDGLTSQQVVRVQVDGVFVSFRTTVNELFAVEENGEPRSLRGFTFTPDADDDPTAFDQLLQ